MLAFLIALAFLADPTPTQQLTGKVIGDDGTLIAGATVRIVGVFPRHGEDFAFPSDAPEIGRASTTDAEGTFTLDGTNPCWKYALFADAVGYIPIILEQRSFRRGPEIVIKLKPRPHEIDVRTALRGRVLDPDGKPIAGALVRPFGEPIPKGHSWGPPTGADECGITGNDGWFLLACNKEARLIDLRVHAVGCAALMFEVSSGTNSDIQLSRGVTVTGRLTKDGKPVSGVGIIMNPERKDFAEHPDLWLNIGTDDNGRFTFRHVPSDWTYRVAAKMDSLGSRGLTRPALVAIVEGQDKIDIGDLAVEPGLSLSGELVSTPDEGLPAGAKILLSRSDFDDTAILEVGADGKFEFHGIPAGKVMISFDAQGWSFSSENVSFDRITQGLLGMLTESRAISIKINHAAEEDVSGLQGMTYRKRGAPDPTTRPIQGIPDDK